MIRTLIEWATHTLNFWWGCSKVSPGCAHCYAEILAKLFSRGKATWGPHGVRWLRFAAAARELEKIVRIAHAEGVRPRVFVNSMSDTFEDHPALTEIRNEMLNLFALTRDVDFLLLTKRPENVRPMVPAHWLTEWPAHVWVGTTVENQEMAERRIPELLAVPARVRFLSCEPLLGPLEIEEYLEDMVDGGYVLGSAPIHWVICGGESGGKARPMQYAWAAGLRDQCSATGVPFFFKQWGEFVPMPGNVPGTLTSVVVDGRKRRWVRAGDEIAVRIGKKQASRIFDGVEHNGVPEVGA